MLLTAFQAVHEMRSIEGFLPDHQRELLPQQWADILTRLSPVEAALLQDFAWWGPLMNQRLRQLSDIHSSFRIDQ